MPKYQNTVFDDYQSRFLVIFSSNYRHRLELKIPFRDHIFSIISKHRTENLHFPSTCKYYTLFLCDKIWPKNFLFYHKTCFSRKQGLYLFYYNTIFNNHVLFEQTQSSIEIGVIVIKKHMPF